MGNSKYPLNGRYLTLADLVYEYGFNTIIEDPAIMQKDFVECLKNTGSDSFINTYNVDVSTKYIKFITDSSGNIDIDTNADTYYTNFAKDLLDENGRSQYPYDICYFPTVYSTTERTADNKSYKKIQEGDDLLYNPDRYIKMQDVDTNNRIPILFHYVANNIEFSATYDTRFLFNYKRSNGEATASYALQKIYELCANANISIDTINNYIKCILPDLSTNLETFVENGIVKPDAYKILCNQEQNKNPECNIDKISEYITNKLPPCSSDTYSYYYEYDTVNNLKLEETQNQNLFHKIKYYTLLLVNSQRYKTGFIFTAKLDNLNKNHIYKPSDILYRCDVGANLTISDVNYDNSQEIKVLYGLPARTLYPTDTINIDLPIITKSAVTDTSIMYHKQFTMAEIEQLLILGSAITDDMPNVTYEYMQLQQRNNNGEFVNVKLNTDDIKNICKSSLHTERFPSQGQFLVKSLDEVSIDSSLNIYNITTNPGYDTSMMYNSNMFVGRLYSNIKYNNYYFKCNIPIYRLANYYYVADTVSTRLYYLYLIKPDMSIFGTNNVGANIQTIQTNYPQIEYTVNNAQIIMGESIDVYMMIYDTIQKTTIFISGDREIDNQTESRPFNNRIYYTLEDNKAVPASILGSNVYYNIGKESTMVSLNDTDTFTVGIQPINTLNSTLTVFNRASKSISVIGKCKSIQNGVSAIQYLYTGYINSNEFTDSIGLAYVQNNNNQVFYNFFLYLEKTEDIELLIKKKSEYCLLLFNADNIDKVSYNSVIPSDEYDNPSYEITGNNNQYKLFIYDIPVYCYKIVPNAGVKFNLDNFATEESVTLPNNNETTIFSLNEDINAIFTTESGIIKNLFNVDEGVDLDWNNLSNIVTQFK